MLSPPSLLLQLLLTNDPQLVPLVASLMEVVLRHNEERLSRLYSTGVMVMWRVVAFFVRHNEERLSRLYSTGAVFFC